MMSVINEGPEEEHMNPSHQEDLGNMTPLPTNTNNFRFGAKNYFLTWSQIGDLDNDVLQHKIESFGAHVKCVF
jgi:hypothetical protein